jgi:protein-S-isoprenylcysteine O-methyltransferase Ste14
MKEKIQGLIPSILAISFIVFLIIYSAYLLINSNGLNQTAMGILIISYAVWIFAEMGTTSREMKKGSTESDGKSLEFYALSRGVMITITLLGVRNFEFFNLKTYLGIFFFVFFIFFRFYAIRTLGEFYSHRVRLNEGHQIINYGPYRYLRHPAYTGMVLANLFYVFIFFNLFGLLAFLCLFLPAIIYRIKVEEVALFKLENYEKVMGPKSRLIPFVW